MKEVAKVLEITKDVTTYAARHSFASVLQRSGVSTEVAGGPVPRHPGRHLQPADGRPGPAPADAGPPRPAPRHARPRRRRQRLLPPRDVSLIESETRGSDSRRLRSLGRRSRPPSPFFVASAVSRPPPAASGGRRRFGAAAGGFVASAGGAEFLQLGQVLAQLGAFEGENVGVVAHAREPGQQLADDQVVAGELVDLGRLHALRLGALAAGPVRQAKAPAVVVRPLGGVDDQGRDAALHGGHLAEVEEDVKVALGVDDVAQDGVDLLPAAEAGDVVDGDDHRAAGAGDGDVELGAFPGAGLASSLLDPVSTPFCNARSRPPADPSSASPAPGLRDFSAGGTEWSGGPAVRLRHAHARRAAVAGTGTLRPLVAGSDRFRPDLGHGARLPRRALRRARRPGARRRGHPRPRPGGGGHRRARRDRGGGRAVPAGRGCRQRWAGLGLRVAGDHRGAGAVARWLAAGAAGAGIAFGRGIPGPGEEAGRAGQGHGRAGHQGRRGRAGRGPGPLGIGRRATLAGGGRPPHGHAVRPRHAGPARVAGEGLHRPGRGPAHGRARPGRRAPHHQEPGGGGAVRNGPALGGRRGAAVGLFYRLYGDHQEWEPPGGRTPVEGVAGGWQASLPDGRALLFLAGPRAEVVLETNGIDDSSRSDLAYAVARQLAGD